MRVRARKLLDQDLVCGKTDVRMDLSGPMGFSLDREDEVGGPGLDTGQHSDANTVFVCKVQPPLMPLQEPSSHSLAQVVNVGIVKWYACVPLRIWGKLCGR